MMTKILKIIAAIHLGIGSINISQALDISVPDEADIVEQSTAIYWVKLRVENNEVLGEILKKLKGAEDQKEATIKITSPYPEMSFPFQAWVRENVGKEVIVLGRWLPEGRAISLVFGPGSTWPKNGPKNEGKIMSTNECVKFIEKKITEKPEAKTE